MIGGSWLLFFLEKYFKMSIYHGNHDAMKMLGYYFYTIHNYDKMIKYYNMAISHNNNDALVYLGNYYRQIKDYINMEKYYLLFLSKSPTTRVGLYGYLISI